jgi:nucleotide-binding universal stress UspA family protein
MVMLEPGERLVHHRVRAPREALATSVTIGSLARHLLAEASCDVLVSRP